MILRRVKIEKVGDIIKNRGREFCYFILTKDSVEYSAICFAPIVLDLALACDSGLKTIDAFCTKKEGELCIAKILNSNYNEDPVKRYAVRVQPSEMDLIEKWVAPDVFKKALAQEGITKFSEVLTNSETRQKWHNLKNRMLSYAQTKEIKQHQGRA